VVLEGATSRTRRREDRGLGRIDYGREGVDAGPSSEVTVKVPPARSSGRQLPSFRRIGQATDGAATSRRKGVGAGDYRA